MAFEERHTDSAMVGDVSSRRYQRPENMGTKRLGVGAGLY
jgi:hypothetical protein